MASKHYVGIRVDSGQREVFKHHAIPTQHSHGHLYVMVIGPFRTLRGAEYMAAHGANNPHLQTVRDAERAAKHLHNALVKARETGIPSY